MGVEITDWFQVVPPADPVVQGSQELDFWQEPLQAMNPHGASPPRLTRTALHLCLAGIAMRIWSTMAGDVLHLDTVAVCCMSQLCTFSRVQCKRTPELSTLRRSKLPKNKAWGSWRKDQVCGKAEAAVSPECAYKSHWDVCVTVISSCLRVRINDSWVTQGNFPEPFLSLPCLTAHRQERSCWCSDVNSW